MSKLARKIDAQDISGLLDQRGGQQHDYVFTPAIKGELIQQFVIDLVSEGKTSGAALSKHLKERCGCELSARTILHHLNDMGLSNLKHTLSAHLEAVKKLHSLLSAAMTPALIKQHIGTDDQAQRPRLWMRLGIMVLCRHGIDSRQIAQFLGCHVQTARTWGARFAHQESIRDRARPGANRYSGKRSAKKSLPFSASSRRSLVMRAGPSVRPVSILRKIPIIWAVISPSVGPVFRRLLDAHALKPHRCRYFLQLSDAEFFPRWITSSRFMRRCRRTCFDECTGIQALETVAPGASRCAEASPIPGSGVYSTRCGLGLFRVGSQHWGSFYPGD